MVEMVEITSELAPNPHGGIGGNGGNHLSWPHISLVEKVEMVEIVEMTSQVAPNPLGGNGGNGGNHV